MTLTQKALSADKIQPTHLRADIAPDARMTALPEFVALVSAGGVITSVSPSITDALGFAPDQVIGTQVALLAHPDDGGALRDIASTGEYVASAIRDVPCRLQDTNGAWRWFLLTAASMVPASAGGTYLLTFRGAGADEIAPHPAMRTAQPTDHFVQLYESDDFLVESVGAYVVAGLERGEACIVVATEAHRDALALYCQAHGIDIAAAHEQRHYVALDADKTLARFMVDDIPDAEKFVATVGALIEQAAASHQHARVFGEMVALLWAEGNASAAIRLEDLWNTLLQERPRFTLCCAYPMRSFVGGEQGSQFTDMCSQHSHVIPNESYTELASVDARMRAISLLQQKATSLKAETAERISAETRLRLVAESMPQMIYTAKPDGAVDYFNPQSMRYTGLPYEAIRGWGWTQFIHPDDVEANLREWRRCLQTGESFYFEHRFLRNDGVYCWHMSRAVPMRDASGAITLWIGSSTDIDEQKQLEQRKNAFISMASHELKTPVTSLKGFTQVLQRRLRQQRADPQTLLFLDRMDAQLRRMTGLISDLLDISKMQTGAVSFRECVFDLDAVAQETIENVQAASVTTEIRVVGESGALISGDPDRIGQVIVNLLTNAIKYSPEANTVVVRLSADADRAEVAVQDFGMGIPKEYHERIFEQFFQVTEPRGSTFPGLGIGLYIARTIVERHGGRLWVESAPGLGSTFHFTLPLAAATAMRNTATMVDETAT
ncbi:MAG TPA: ATP-binding protein [Ktedonobacterales bacterium]|nr:ATP-binding protein [Ktedonobacterales bacterium]